MSVHQLKPAPSRSSAPLIYSPNPEQALIGLVLRNRDNYLWEFNSSHFTLPAHSVLWEEIVDLIEEDLRTEELLPTLIHRTGNIEPLQLMGGGRYLAEMAAKAPGGANPRTFAREIDVTWWRAWRDHALRSDRLIRPSAIDIEVMDDELETIHRLWSDTSRGLPLIDPASWGDQLAPVRSWALRDWIPANQATYMTGAGGAGKSLLGQQLATCMAAGRPFLGEPVSGGAAIYLTCEDDAGELHRRQDAICDMLDVSRDEMGGRLHLVSLVGAIGNELAAFDPQNRMTTTPAWARLRETVMELRPSLIVLDNVAHLFAGNENIRAQVAAFCSLLNGLAAEAGCAVLFIGHPNKAGEDFSGSTAWENQVRSRIFLQIPDREKGEFTDADRRVLSRQKANYAKRGEAIEFRWHRWAFVRDEDLAPAEAGAVAATILANTQDQRFLECLAKATVERRNVSTSRNASNFAPKLFATMPTALGTRARAFEAAMGRLLHEGSIIDGQPVFQRPNRSWVTGLAAAPRSAPTSAPTLD